MARPLIPMTGGIPMPTASDSGKVLTVGETGKYGLAAVPSELPASAAVDEGKVLTVNSSGAPAWANVPTELPASAAIDEGKVLTVDSSGAPAWATPGGGLFIVNATGFSINRVLDKTYADIISAISAGKTPLVAYDGGYYSIAHISSTSPDNYVVGVWNGNTYGPFVSTTETGVLTFYR